MQNFIFTKKLVQKFLSNDDNKCFGVALKTHSGLYWDCTHLEHTVLWIKKYPLKDPFVQF